LKFGGLEFQAKFGGLEFVIKFGGLESTKSNSVLSITSEEDEEIAADAICRKYGIADKPKESKTAKKKKSSNKNTETSFGETVLENISPQTQSKIDNTLVTLTFSSLVFVILSGVGISIGALKIVFPSLEISPETSAVVDNILSPAFTPALCFFLLCSTTFGLFKFAQISSSQTVYKE